MSKKEIAKQILLVAGMIGVLVLLILFVRMNAKKDQETTETPLTAERVSQTVETMNLLVVGADRTSGLHDVLMLVHVDMTAPRAVILQIPRDTYAAYTEGSYRKLNGASRALGGEEKLCVFLSESLGITIDRYVSLDSDTLVSVVDAIGGVEITLPDALHYEDPAQSLSIHLPAGTQTLDGKQAEYFVRYRMGYVRGDLGRMDAQKLFLASLAGKLRASMTLSSALRLAAEILPKMDTNLTLGQAARLVRTFFSTAQPSVLMLTLPGEEAVATKSGASYYAVSAPATEEILVRYFGARVGEFDREHVFCNSRYQSFCRIYDGYCPYTVYSMEEITEQGIEIEKTRG